MGTVEAGSLKALNAGVRNKDLVSAQEEEVAERPGYLCAALLPVIQSVKKTRR